MTSVRLLSIILAVLLCVSTIRCKRKDGTVAPTIAALEGNWRLVEPDSTHEVMLQFAYDTRNPPQDITPFTASGKAVINDYTLRLFATVDGTMSAENLGHTERNGSTEVTQFEQAYFDNLTTVAWYKLIAPNRLHMHHGGKQPGVLVYEKIK